MKLIFILFSVAICSSLVAQTSYVPPTKLLTHKGYQLGVTGEYFKSSKRIDKDGKDQPFEQGESFSRLQSEVSGAYGLTNNFQVGGGVGFRQNDSAKLNTVTSEMENETSVGVQSTFFNFMYAFRPVDRLQYTLDGLVRYMPYTNEETTAGKTGKFILGDDGAEYSFGLGVTYSSIKSNYLTFKGGYRIPGNDMSAEFYWLVEGALTWKTIALVAGVDGVSSLDNDPYKDDPQNKPNLNTGSTYLYNSTNREWITPYVGVNFALNPNWRVELKGRQVISGVSTDLGTAFGASLIRRVENKKTGKLDSKFKDYDFEANVTKVSAKKGFVVIDKGLADDVRKGMKLDFFQSDYLGGNVLLARGVVLQVKASTSVIKITEVFNTKGELKEGTLARGVFR